MSDSRSDPMARKISLLLSSLVTTADDGLSDFRAKRVADPDLDLATIERARAILDAVGYALLSRERANWRHVDEAWEFLRRINRPVDTPEVVRSTRPKYTTLESPAVPPMPSMASPAAPATLPAGHHAVVDIAVAPWTPLSADPLPFTRDLPRPPALSDLDTTVNSLTLGEGGLPFDKPRPSEPGLTLEQYAFLQAELQSAPPSEHAPIAGRYGLLSDAARKELESSWHLRMTDDDGLRMRFSALVAHYASWLAAQKG